MILDFVVEIFAIGFVTIGTALLTIVYFILSEVREDTE